MHLDDLVFSKHRTDHDPAKHLAEVTEMNPINQDKGDWTNGKPLVEPHAYEMWGDSFDDVNWRQAPAKLSDVSYAGQYVELLWMALLRDVSWAKFETDVMAREARQELKEVWGIDDPFRPAVINDGGGEYISRLLRGSVPDGDPSFRQLRYCSDFTGQGYGTTLEEAYEIQSGEVPDMLAASSTRELPMHYSPRTLASVVRQDWPLKFCIQASLMLEELGVRCQFDEADSLHVPFVRFGLTHLHRVMSYALHDALRLAFVMKWDPEIGNVARPELYGIALENRRLELGDWGLDSGFDDRISHSQAFRETISQNGSALLSQCYPEGSPPHPARPAGHSLVASTCATVLKIWFRNSQWPSDLSREAPTVHNEITKLGSNVANGRSWAGVHWRDDNVLGQLVGEELALARFGRWCPEAVGMKASIVTFDGMENDVYFNAPE